MASAVCSGPHEKSGAEGEVGIADRIFTLGEDFVSEQPHDFSWGRFRRVVIAIRAARPMARSTSGRYTSARAAQVNNETNMRGSQGNAMTALCGGGPHRRAGDKCHCSEQAG